MVCIWEVLFLSSRAVASRGLTTKTTKNQIRKRRETVSNLQLSFLARHIEKVPSFSGLSPQQGKQILFSLFSLSALCPPCVSDCSSTDKALHDFRAIYIFFLVVLAAEARDEKGEKEGGGAPSPIRVVAEIRGRHKIQAELKRLEQEIRFLEDELQELEKVEKASVSCKEFLRSMGSLPDPLLPNTIHPVNASWDRWFEGPRESRSVRCSIL